MIAETHHHDKTYSAKDIYNLLVQGNFTACGDLDSWLKIMRLGYQDRLDNGVKVAAFEKWIDQGYRKFMQSDSDNFDSWFQHQVRTQPSSNGSKPQDDTSTTEPYGDLRQRLSGAAIVKGVKGNPARNIPLNVDLAGMLGINEAAIIQQIHYWCSHHQTTISPSDSTWHWYENEWWTYNTYAVWQENFSWLSLRTIQRTLKYLEEIGIIFSRKHDNDKMGKWYRVDYQSLRLLFAENGMEIHLNHVEHG